MSQPGAEPNFLSVNSTEWSTFIKTKPDATIFHHPAWINLLSECYRFKSFALIVRDGKERIIAGVPVIEIPGILGKKWVSLPFTDYCNPLCQDTHALNLLRATIISLFKTKKISRLELRWNYQTDRDIAVDTKYVLSLLKLNQDPEVVSGHIRHKYFRKVKAAQERGVSTEMGVGVKQLKEFYELHLHNRHKLGIPIQPWKYFELLLNQVLVKKFGFLITAYKNQVCIAAALFLSWNKTLIFKYSAVNAEGRRSLAMDLILWNAICWGCENNMDILDLGRTDLPDSGLLEFKKRWGADLMPLSYSYIPFEETTKKSNPILSLSKGIIRHSPTWVCQLSGEMFYRYFA